MVTYDIYSYQDFLNMSRDPVTLSWLPLPQDDITFNFWVDLDVPIGNFYGGFWQNSSITLQGQKLIFDFHGHTFRTQHANSGFGMNGACYNYFRNGTMLNAPRLMNVAGASDITFDDSEAKNQVMFTFCQDNAPIEEIVLENINVDIDRDTGYNVVMPFTFNSNTNTKKLIVKDSNIGVRLGMSGAALQIVVNYSSARTTPVEFEFVNTDLNFDINGVISFTSGNTPPAQMTFRGLDSNRHRFRAIQATTGANIADSFFNIVINGGRSGAMIFDGAQTITNSVIGLIGEAGLTRVIFSAGAASSGCILWAYLMDNPGVTPDFAAVSGPVAIAPYFEDEPPSDKPYWARVSEICCGASARLAAAGITAENFLLRSGMLPTPKYLGEIDGTPPFPVSCPVPPGGGVAKLYVKVNGEWTSEFNLYVKKDGAWRKVDAVYLKNAGTWVKAHSANQGE